MKHHGFTLIELMVTLAIAAIVLTIGVPSFQSVIRNNQLTTQVNNVLAAINLARSEAIKRDAKYNVSSTTQIQRVVICAKATTGDTCKTTAGSTDWSDGWIVFLSRQLSDLTIVTSDILRIYEAMPSSYALKANTNFVAYDNTSLSKDLSNSPTTLLKFSLCYNNSKTDAKSLNINAVGRAKVAASFNSTTFTCAP